MANNEILPFAGTDTGTNLLTQAEYLADAQRPIGNQPGVARSKLVNKALRQASLIAAGVAGFLANNQSNNITDNLTPQTIADYMATVVRSLGIPTAVAGGTANAITADFTPNVALTNGTTVIVRAGSANTTTTPTFAPDGLTAKTIVKGNNLPLAVGDIAGAGHWLELAWDSTLTKWVLLNPATGLVSATSASVQGSFKNLACSATGLNANVSISADEIALEDSANLYVTARTVSLTVAMTSAGANGLDTGTVAASTWYSLWVIRKPDGTTAGLASLSATAPTVPSGYTYKARVGWIRTDGTANKYPLSFKQYGRRVQYVTASGTNVATLPMMASGAGIGSLTTPTWVSVAWAAFVPPTASRIQVIATNQTSNQVSVVPNNNFGVAGSTTNPPPTCYFSNGLFEFELESSNIYWANQGATSQMKCLGWEDNI